MSKTNFLHRSDETAEKAEKAEIFRNIATKSRPFSPRSPRSDRYLGESDRSPTTRGGGLLAEICDLDKEIIRLITRRSRLLGKMASRQTNTGSGSAENERDLRLSWEKNVSLVSRDPRFVRQLFALLREVEVTSADMDLPVAYNLAPLQKSLALDLPAPPGDRRIRAAMCLSAASGVAVDFSGVSLNNAVLECLKMLNQVGGNLRWEDDGQILCRAGNPVAGMQASRTGLSLDKVIYVGTDPFNLYLLLFLMTTRPTRLKIIGEGDVRLLDMTALRHFLPKVGTRLTAAVPGQEGLPVRLESSALPPSEVFLTDDLPYDAALALCLSAPFYATSLTIRAGTFAEAQKVFAEAVSLLEAADISSELGDDFLRPKTGRVSFATQPKQELNLPIATTLLAMPAFVSGKARLYDKLVCPQELFTQAKTLLEQAGLQITEDDKSWISTPQKSENESVALQNLPNDLFPIGLALALIPILRKGSGHLPALPEKCDLTLVDDFLSRLGLGRSATQQGAEGYDLEKMPENAAPWTAPDSGWALALALVAFAHPHLKLSNPAIVTAQTPDFWGWYNSLPTPTLRPRAVQFTQEQVRPVARRRIIAEYMPESERPEPLPQNDDDL